MVENSTSVPLPPSVDDHRKVISDFLDSSEWSEQLRIARQKREEVLARKAHEKLAASKVDATDSDVSRGPEIAAETPPPHAEDPVADNLQAGPAAPAAQVRLAHSPFENLPALGRIGNTAGTRANPFASARQFPDAENAPPPTFGFVAADIARLNHPAGISPARPDTDVVRGGTKPHTLRQARRAPVLQRGLVGLGIGILAGFGIGWMLQAYWTPRPFGTAQSESGIWSDAYPTPALPHGALSSASDAAPIIPPADTGLDGADFTRSGAKLQSLAAADAPVSTALPPVPPIGPLSTTAFKAEHTDRPLIAAPERTRFKLLGNPSRLAQPRDDAPYSPADQRAIADLPQYSVALLPTPPSFGLPASAGAEPVAAARDSAVAQIRNSTRLTVPARPDAKPVVSTDSVLFQAASYNVVLHVTGSDSGTKARAQLAGFGIVNARTVSTGFKPARAMVAYYAAQDAAVAQKIAGLYDGVVMDLTGFAPAPPARTVEIYLTY